MAISTLTALEEMTPQIIGDIREALDVAKQNMNTVKENMIKNAELRKEDIKNIKKALKEEHAKSKQKIKDVEEKTEKLVNDLWKDGAKRIEAICNGLEALLGANKLKEKKENLIQSVNSIINNVIDNLHQMAKDYSKELDDIYDGSVTKVK